MITVSKDIRGSWHAEDSIDLAGGRQLRISTMKVSGGALVTRATVGKVDGHFFSYVVYQDFSKCIKTSRDRCTSKTVAAQHGMAMGQIETLKVEIAAHYAAEEATS